MWRVCAAREVPDTLRPRKAGAGRWNPEGMPMVYASSTRALALLEVVANAGGAPPPRQVAVEIALPAACCRVASAARLPRHWCSPRSPRACREFGRRWLVSGRSAALCVPSALVPQETNVLINPRHPDCRRMRVRTVEPFQVDARLRRG